MNKKGGVLIIVILSLFLISFVSAAGTSFDNAQLITEGEIKGGGSNSEVFAEIHRTEDYYKMNLEKNDKITALVSFVTDSKGDNNIYLYIYNSNEEKLAETFISSEGITTEGIIEYISTEPEMIYIKVNTKAGNLVDTKYNLKINLEKDVEPEVVDDFSKDNLYNFNYPPDYKTSLSSSIFKGSIVKFFLIFFLAFYVYLALTLFFIAKKTNTENGWFGFVPILNLILMAKIGRVPLWTVILMLVPLINIFVLVWWWMKISEARSKPKWWGILILLPIANLIIMGILAWGNNKNFLNSRKFRHKDS